MNRKYHNSEKGQAIVYLVLGLVVFLGFVALAVDGGMALADRRHSQNLADASSLAGGGKAATILGQVGCPAVFTCNDTTLFNAEQYAIDRAFDNNGYVIDRDLSDHNGVDATCVNDSTGHYIDVTVEISNTTPSNFLQLIYPDALHNEVEAVTRVYPGGPLTFGNAITALNPAECNSNDVSFEGVTVGGAGTVHVTDGDIFSNGCIRQNSSVDVDIVDPYKALGHYFKPDPLEWAESTTEFIPPSDYRINPPDCTANGGAFLKTGDQFKDLMKKGPLDPGLYCITGDVKITQGNGLSGYGVTIAMLDGFFDVQGSPEIHLLAPGVPIPPDNTEKTPIVSPAIEGLLIYMAPSNLNNVTLAGNSDSYFSGLIYAPNPDTTTKLSGTGQNIYQNSQVIAWNITIEGTADLWVHYYGCNGYISKPSLDLHK